MGHGHQLEAGKLQHRIVLRVHFGRLAQEGISNVAAHMNGFPGGLQELCNNGRSGGLAVRPGHSQERAGANLKKHFHLRGDLTALGLSRQQLRHIGPQTRGAEAHILV